MFKFGEVRLVTSELKTKSVKEPTFTDAPGADDRLQLDAFPRLGFELLKMLGGFGAKVIVKETDPLPAAFVAVIVMGKVPVSVEIPEIAPDAESNASPFGSVPVIA
jgi:hypothetical protein